MNPALFKLAGKHFVAVYFIMEDDSALVVPNRRPNCGLIQSGVVVSVENHWFILLAKHCCDQIRDLQATGRRVKKCRVFDSWTPSATSNEPVPIDYDGSWKLLIGGDDDFDVAAIPLRPNAQQLLAANGVEALSEPAWAAPPDNCDLYWMMGVPSSSHQMLEQNGIPTVPSAFQVLALDIERLEARPESLKHRDSPYFFGKLIGNWTDQNGNEIPRELKGMSGGPILGVKKSGGEMKYWLVAIQSAWHKDTEEIAGASAAVAGSSLREMIRSIQGVIQESKTK